MTEDVTSRGSDSGTYDLTVEDQRCHLAEITPEQDLWENHAFIVRGESDDGIDVTLWTSPYIIHRGPHSYYAGEMDIMQTMLIAGRFSAEDKLRMHDNDFIAAGWSPREYLPHGSVHVDHHEDRVVWKVLGRTFEDSPPRWRVGGEHGGVTLDLQMDAEFPSFTIHPHDGFAENGITWYEAMSRCAGRIGHAGREVEISGNACHERVIVTRDHEPHLMQGRGLFIHHVFADDVQAWVMTAPSSGVGLAYVVDNGKVWRAEGPDDVVIEEVDTWVDPRSGFEIGSRWRVRVSTPGGTLEMTSAGYARAYYPWSPFADTWNILYWLSAEGGGSFTRADGHVVAFDHAKVVAHTNRVFFDTRLDESELPAAAWGNR